MKENIWGFKAVAALCFAILIGMGVMGYVGGHRQPSIVEAAASYNPKAGEPCALNMRIAVPINLIASGQVITGTANKQVYICHISFVTGAAQNIALVEGTGSTCGTNTVGMAGGNAAATGWNFAINQSWVEGSGNWWINATQTAGDNVCLLLSGVGQTSGEIVYAQQ